MKIDKQAMKKAIDKAKLDEIQIFHINSVELNSWKSVRSALDKSVHKNFDYVISLIRK